MATTESTGTGTMRRRGVMAAAALVAGMAIAQPVQRVAATSTDTNYIAEGGSGIGFRCNSGYANGAVFSGTVFGVEGSSVDGAGVRGLTLTGSGYAVYGQSTYSYGVVGRSYGTRGAGYDAGVLGIAEVDTATAIAVQGSVTGSAGFGVLGGRKGTGGAFNGYGVKGMADGGAGVGGEAATGKGVIGISDSGWGVWGEASSSGTGVYGKANGNGTAVYGEANGGSGVIGTGTFSGVLGFTSGTGYNRTGVTGTGNGGLTRGVRGLNSGTGIGVYGEAPQFGVVGNATASGGYGIYGLATVDGSAGFAGGTNNANAYAAVFGGRVVVNGPFTVTGAKSAALPHPDGSHRLVYCVEAPESWLEDFGTGKIVAGRAEVQFDPDFAAIIDPKEVHVFLTEHDDNNALHVPTRSATGFTVQASASAITARGKRTQDINSTFSYRVVARRKDIPANRLAKVEIPQIKMLTLPAEPPPQPPAQPPVLPVPTASAGGGAIATPPPRDTGGPESNPPAGSGGANGMGTPQPATPKR